MKLEPGQLSAHYQQIFQDKYPHAQNNRNAAGHLWSAHILEQADQLTVRELQQLFSEFCPVSGSWIDPQRNSFFAYTRQGNRLHVVEGGSSADAVAVAHCCSPCICDLQDGARVIDYAVTTSEGPAELPMLVLRRNPCLGQPDGPLQGQHVQAPAMHCTDGHLTGAVRATAENGQELPIIGLVQNTPQTGRPSLVDYCEKRKRTAQKHNNTYQGGMGNIFRNAAGV